MRILTYNLNHRKNIIEQWRRLAEFNADILLLQEVRPPAQWAQDELGPDYEQRLFWTPMNEGWGSAVYAKHGVARPIEVPGCRGWAIGAELTNPFPASDGASHLRVFSVHIADQPYLKTALTVLNAIKALKLGDNIVIGGDFNRTVGIQHADRSGLVTEADGWQIMEFMRQHFELMSGWQAVNPNRELAQTLRLPANPTKFHCDGLFVPAGWYRALQTCEIPQGEPWLALSDHNPVVLTMTAGERAS